MKALILLFCGCLAVSGCADLFGGPRCAYTSQSRQPVIHIRPKPKTQKMAGVIYFADGSAKLTADEKSLLQNIADYAKKNNTELKVLGHASSRTKKTTLVEHTMINLNISGQRALNVVKTLASDGVPLNKMCYEALSDSRPAEIEKDAKTAALNRRVEIFYVY